MRCLAPSPPTQLPGTEFLISKYKFINSLINHTSHFCGAFKNKTFESTFAPTLGLRVARQVLSSQTAGEKRGGVLNLRAVACRGVVGASWGVEPSPCHGSACGLIRISSRSPCSTRIKEPPFVRPSKVQGRRSSVTQQILLQYPSQTWTSA